MHLVHEARAKILADRLDAATEPNILRSGGLFGAPPGLLDPPVTKWKVVPPSISIGLRG
jgi:hypothetical protein